MVEVLEGRQKPQAVRLGGSREEWEIEAAWRRDEAQPFGPPVTVFTEA
ncbi:MAG TPA: hypothetical protein VL099_16410 [Candidatus Binatia bacterium]|nr:hypothetical protein [Candidatus Binatia bacterium]